MTYHEGYYLSASDRCPDEDPAANCFDDLDYCLEFGETEWRNHEGELTFVICHGVDKIVTFHASDHVPEPRIPKR